MISIREVARLAEVSPATVSRVINGTAKVAEEKRKRVEKVIKETGFIPNEVARSLFKKSAHIIGVIIPDIKNPYFNQMAEAIEKEAYKKGYKLTLCNSDNDTEKQKNYIRMLGRMHADGIILLINTEEVLNEICYSEIPIVILDRKINISNVVTNIHSDNYMGGRISTEHLVECGCTNIVNLRGPQNHSSGRNRFEGYLDVCKEHNLTPMYIDCEYDYEDGLLKTTELLEKFPNVDGIIAANDMVAISAYKVLKSKNYKVPEDIQIVGFDNVVISKFFSPEITTVEQPIAMMGKKAVDVLIDHIDGKTIKKEHIFPVNLVKRETTTVLNKDKAVR